MVELTLVFTGVNVAFLEDVGVLTASRLRLESPELFGMIDSLGYHLFRFENVA
jgi:hypothetical protein